MITRALSLRGLFAAPLHNPDVTIRATYGADDSRSVNSPSVQGDGLVSTAAVSALVGGIAELFAGRGVGDNFSIPLLCGGVASLLL